jgi:hypothetical protein
VPKRSGMAATRVGIEVRGIVSVPERALTLPARAGSMPEGHTFERHRVARMPKRLSIVPERLAMEGEPLTVRSHPLALRTRTLGDPGMACRHEPVLPELVGTDDHGYKTVRYGAGLEMLTLQALREANAQVAAQSAQISAQETELKAQRKAIQQLEEKVNRITAP